MAGNTSEEYTYDTIKQTADWLLSRTQIRPKVAIVCGSGLGSLTTNFKDTEEFEYKTIPNFPTTTVEGHIGKLVFGFLESKPVVAMQGRFHFYEGIPLDKCSMYVRVFKLLGITHLLLTNAAGGLNVNYKTGDIMVIRDHINMMGLSGNNPLRGPNEKKFGVRFPPMANCYDNDLIEAAKRIAKELGINKNVHEGLYACVGGPNYETVAECNALRKMGADAVGMSTAHEVVTAVHCGLVVFAFSLITNECPQSYNANQRRVSHEEVIAVSKQKQNICSDLMCGIVAEICR